MQRGLANFSVDIAKKNKIYFPTIKKNKRKKRKIIVIFFHKSLVAKIKKRNVILYNIVYKVFSLVNVKKYQLKNLFFLNCNPFALNYRIVPSVRCCFLESAVRFLALAKENVPRIKKRDLKIVQQPTRIRNVRARGCIYDTINRGGRLRRL